MMVVVSEHQGISTRASLKTMKKMSVNILANTLLKSYELRCRAIGYLQTVSINEKKTYLCHERVFAVLERYQTFIRVLLNSISLERRQVL